MQTGKRRHGGFANEASEEAEAAKSLALLERKMDELIKFTRTNPNFVNSFRKLSHWIYNMNVL